MTHISSAAADCVYLPQLDIALAEFPRYLVTEDPLPEGLCGLQVFGVTEVLDDTTFT